MKKNIIIIISIILVVGIGIGIFAFSRSGKEQPDNQTVSTEQITTPVPTVEPIEKSTPEPTVQPTSEPTPEPLYYTMDGEEYEVVCTLTDFLMYSDFRELQENAELIVIGHFVEDAVEKGNASTNAFEITQVLKGSTDDDVIQIYQRYTVNKSSKRIVAYSHLTPMENGSEWICFLKYSDSGDTYYQAGDTMGRYPFREIDTEKLMNGEYSSNDLGVYQAEDFRYDIYAELLREYDIRFE